MVDLRLGGGRARALALEMDLLGVTPIESICIGLNLVLEHCLGHFVKRADSDVGALSPLFNLETQHDGRSARNWMKRV